MNVNMEWYFSASILGFCVVALAMRTGTAMFNRLSNRDRLAGEPQHASPGQWLAARFSRRADNWYCFFHMPDLTGTTERQRQRQQKQARTASKPRLRVIAPRM